MKRNDTIARLGDVWRTIDQVNAKTGEIHRKTFPIRYGRHYQLNSAHPPPSSTGCGQPRWNHDMTRPSSWSERRPWLEIHPTIQEALQQGQPVVALESTLVAHGMPFPDNLQCMQRITSILLEHRVQPATVAIRDGVGRVGLTQEELEDLARAGEQGRAFKCTTRDLPMLLSQQRQRWLPLHAETLAAGDAKATFWGATTVASTMMMAHAAGISTFVTGGIGGVHRGAESSMDISADLLELSRTPVVVVSAGIKSILDIGKTLEVLETYSVPTIAYQTDEFPAFFSPHSGIQAPARLDSAQDIALAYLASREMGLMHGMLVAVPNHDPAGEHVEMAIQNALTQAQELGIRGPAITPFILRKVAEVTAGDSLRSNMALVEGNARVGAAIALAIAENTRMSSQGEIGTRAQAIKRRPLPSYKPDQSSYPPARVIVMGGCVIDIVAKPQAGYQLLLGTSNPSTCYESDGGVGRNIAEVLARLGSAPLLFSAVGNDSRGLSLMDRLKRECKVLDPYHTIRVVDGENTATYVAILNEDGDLHTACADMRVLEKIPVPSSDLIGQAEILVFDANPCLESLREAALRAVNVGTKVFFEPTSVEKSRVVAEDLELMSTLSFASPCLSELIAMAGHDTISGDICDDNIKELAISVLRKMHPDAACLIITRGSKGALLASRNVHRLRLQEFPAQSDVQVLNATGAGDSLVGGLIHSLLCGGNMDDALRFGMDAATLSLRSTSAVCNDDEKWDDLRRRM